MADQAPNPELLTSLGRLVRGLSALFWGLPMALVVCVQTANGDWLTNWGILPPVLATALLLYGLSLLGHFQKQERIWLHALDRARIFAWVNVGLSPFLFWWNQVQAQPLFSAMVQVMMASGLLFLLLTNQVLWRLSAMLPDETLRVETKFFSALNRYLLFVDLALVLAYVVSTQLEQSYPAFRWALNQNVLWLVLLLVLAPVALTMALIWKIKEVILSSVFGPGE